MGAISGNGVSIEEALPLDGSQSMTGPLELTIADTDNVVGLTVNQNDTTNNPIAASIVNAGTGNGLSIDQNGNGVSLNIDSEATTADILNISAAVMTTGTVIDIPDADALTTGRVINVRSSSADTSNRILVAITNDNALATSTTCIRMQQDSTNSFIDYAGVSGATTTNSISTLTTSGAVQGHLQIEINGTKRWLAFLADPS